MGIMQEAEYKIWTTSTKGQVNLTSTKGHDDVWGIDDGKGLADGVGR